jgi:hypothetical protein
MTSEISRNRWAEGLKRRTLVLWIGLFLAAATLLVYSRIIGQDFLIFDDTTYVTENVQVQQGLTVAGLKWAFDTEAARETYWHPLVWLSLMVDYEVYGLNPIGFKLTNLLLHLAATLLLFFILIRMTGDPWPSAVVAALFALHPMNVESVAWVAERKSTLSGFFWMLAMGCYVEYVRKPGLGRYLAICLAFGLGLLSKPMLMTFPLAMLLLDFWPLERLNLSWTGGRARFNWPRMGRLILEKAPLLVMSGLLAGLTMFSLKTSGHFAGGSPPGLMLRAANALTSYVTYLGKLVWPTDLAAYYPFPASIPAWKTVTALVFLVFVSGVVLRSWQRRPYLVVGWLWYLGVLLPVSGLVQGGLWPARADRFMYMPAIGLFVMAAWGALDLAREWEIPRRFRLVPPALILAGLMCCSWMQLGYWQDELELSRHTLLVTPENEMANYHFGNALLDRGRYDEAAYHLERAVQLSPRFGAAYNNLGTALDVLGRLDKAVGYYQSACFYNPGDALARYNFGTALARLGRYSEAITQLEEALRLEPGLTKARSNLEKARALMEGGG